MRTWLPALMVLTVVGQDARSVEACGDKFLLVGRGTRFQRAYAAIHPASIVVYAQPQRRAAKAIRDPRLQADLKLAGHKVLVAVDETALGRALDSGSVDLVLTCRRRRARRQANGELPGQARRAARDVRAHEGGGQGGRSALYVPLDQLGSGRPIPHGHRRCDESAGGPEKEGDFVTNGMGAQR